MGGPQDNLLIQLHKTREFKTKGAILFDYAHLSDSYIDALTTRIFNPNYDPRDITVKEEYKPTVKLGEKKKRGRKKH